ncbi:MAG: hypothetical protein ABI723_01685 [Bacteroidia bacterium]
MNTLNLKLITLASLVSAGAIAQTPDDAILFSENTFGTTARSLSMGGAFGALGGDFSSLSQNPGGLGVYRKSEFTFTPAFNLRNVNNQYLGTVSTDSRFYFNIADFGLVGSSVKENKQGWKGWNWAIGYNRENSYKSYSNYQGVNTRNSLLNSYVEQTNGVPVSSLEDIEYAFGPGMAYNLYLINPSASTANTYSSAIPNGGELQRESIETKGNTDNWLFGLANNFNDKFYVGGTFELKALRYHFNSVYDEIDVKDTIYSPYFNMNFKSFSLFKNEYTHGVAAEFKFGMIYKPNDMIRIGAAIHTPAWYGMHYHDDYNMVSQFGAAGDSSFTLNSPPSSDFDYKLNTPFRALGSLAFVFPGKGLISADYEYVDHPSARLRSQSQGVYSFSEENNAIHQYHQGQSIVHIGGEVINGNMSFRLGAAYYGSPYKSGVLPGDYDYSSMSYTGGFGFRDKNYFFDVGYSFTQSKQYSETYSLANGQEPGVQSKINTHRLMFTIGFKFD